MGASLVITLREGLEAALIVGILLAYLSKSGRRDAFKLIWLGVAAAIAVSLGVGAVIQVTASRFEGQAEYVFEGLAMLTATAVLVWMIFWMRKQAKHIKGELQASIDTALAGGSAFALGFLAFIAVVREGIETALFLFATSRTEEPAAWLIGGLLGLVLSVAIGYLLYRGVRVLDLQTFFKFTGILLIAMASGLFAHGLHELQEAGWIPIIVEHLWDVNHILDERGAIGGCLKAVFGYNGNPSLIEVSAYSMFLPGTLWLFLRPPSERAKTATA
jgi:high-affinity iron transporter